MEFDLPAEKEALESALMGADATRILDAFRAWLSNEVAGLAAEKYGSAEHHCKRGVEACALRFEGLIAAPELDESRAALAAQRHESEAHENIL
jgi:hypothetical protein